jgi:hypothetical protein
VIDSAEARRLLALAAEQGNRLQRHLLVAAALRSILSHEPIVVGGTAEEYWTAAEYHETDLDVCAPRSKSDREALEDLGFDFQGRQWLVSLGPYWVAVEFPESRIDGDEDRVVTVRSKGGVARVIGLDDLYLDRLRQATMSVREGVEFRSALAVAAARYDDIDWRYVRRRLNEIERSDPSLANEMRKIDSRIRRRVRSRSAF